MTVTADHKHRMTCSDVFPKGARFDVHKDTMGRIILTRLVMEQAEAELVKPVRRKGLLVIPGEVDEAALSQQIREDREDRNAGLLG